MRITMLKLRLIDKIRYKMDSIKTILHLKYMESKGYILKDGTPIKCPRCKSTSLEDYNIDRTDYIVFEYDRKCKNCGKFLGHWSHRYWNLNLY